MVAGQCTQGYYCSGGAITQNPTGESYGDVCPPGHYCPTGTHTPTPCPAGTYLPTTGAVIDTDCLDCPGGKYCAITGLTNYTGMANVLKFRTLFSFCS